MEEKKVKEAIETAKEVMTSADKENRRLLEELDDNREALISLAFDMCRAVFQDSRASARAAETRDKRNSRVIVVLLGVIVLQAVVAVWLL